MPTWLRWVVVAGMTLSVAGIAWLITKYDTHQQPLSLAVVVDGGTEAIRTVDRLGKMVTQIPIEEEIELGKAIAEEMKRSARHGGSDEEKAYVQAVVDELVENGELRRPEMPYQTSILDIPIANAFALPGGYIYITRGMLDLIETEAELATIMGHEMAHVDLRHCIERIQYEQVAKKVGGAPAETLTAIGYRLISVSFSDELEAESDRQGTLYAARAGYHPQAAQLLFERLERRRRGKPDERDSVEKEVAGMMRDALADYFATHPKTAERIRLLDELFAEQGYDFEREKYYVGYENYQTLTTREKRRYPTELVEHRIYPPE